MKNKLLTHEDVNAIFVLSCFVSGVIFIVYSIGYLKSMDNLYGAVGLGLFCTAVISGTLEFFMETKKRSGS